VYSQLVIPDAEHSEAIPNPADGFRGRAGARPRNDG
jgi:hypothetical protein